MSSPHRRTSRTAGPSIGRAASSAASTGPAGSPVASTTARSGCWPTATRGAGSTVPTTSSSPPTARIWFTDPSYGIRSDYEGHQADEETGGRFVYRIDPDGALTAVVAGPDATERSGLFCRRDAVVRGRQRAAPDLGLRRRRSGSQPAGRLFAADELGYDGIRFDAWGRLWAAAHDGLHCYETDGTLSGKLLVPEITANLAFGGRQGNHLYLTATTSLYTLRVNFRGARYPG